VTAGGALTARVATDSSSTPAQKDRPKDNHGAEEGEKKLTEAQKKDLTPVVGLKVAEGPKKALTYSAEPCGGLLEEIVSLIPGDLNDLHHVRLLEEIGRGTYGVVHKAVWRGSIVAAKVLSSPSSQDIVKEIESSMRIQHPNILCFLGTVRTETSVTILTNYVDGKNLHDMIFNSSSSRMDWSSKLTVAIQVAQALLFLHSSEPPTAHLDIKPANVLVQRQTKQVFLADFGLSRVITTKRVFGTKTMLAGTPGFQPPEQLMAEAIDQRADVYAFGVLLIELFGGRPVWEGLTPFQIITKVVVQKQPPDFSHIVADIQPICSGCLEKKEKRLLM
jgi:serine/threonine protein kinase